MNEGSINFCRREIVQGAVSGMALAAAPALVSAASVAEDADKAAVLAQIPAMHAAICIEAAASRSMGSR